MEIHVEGDEFSAEDHVEKIKKNATRRRGRGFTSVGNDNTEPIDDDEKESNDYENEIADDTEADEEELGPKRSIEGWILFVTGIQEESTEDDIATPFGDFGVIKNIHLNIDRRTGYLKGYALIEYEAFAEAKKALTEMNGKEINGEDITVSWAFVKGGPRGDTRKSHHRRDRSRSRDRR